MRAARLVMIGVEPTYRERLHRFAGLRGMEAVHFEDDGSAAAAPESPALCIAGLLGGSPSDLQRVRRLTMTYPETPLVVLARDVAIDEVVGLMRAGVADVIELPRNAREVAQRSLSRLGVDGRRESEPDLRGDGPEIRRLRRSVNMAAATSATLLITGETGSGKGVVARAVHLRSERRNRPLVHVDCAALSASLIESELFGHERGAFTGAEGRRAGRFELASSGTIFLDEIGDLASSLQTKLLRVLQERTFERVGGTRTLPMRARVIAATNLDLERAVREGRFREDLYYRLNVLRISVPPLRNRREDIPDLVVRGLQERARHLGLSPPNPTAALLHRLASHPWPGNIRQLMNVLERLILLRPDGPLDVADLEKVGEPEVTLHRSALAESSDDYGERSESEVIASVLESTGGNVSRAARRLELPRSTLRYKIKKHALQHLIPDD
jgi:DNA-binding NtrC family response regulator